MRIALTIVLVLVVAVAAFAVARDDDGAPQDAGSVTLVGDSLNVGIEPFLRTELPGWRIDAHDVVGRTTRDGIEELRTLGGTLAPVVVVSLGTNDSDGSENEFRALVGQAVEHVGPNRCLVWATIVRDGSPRTGFNDVLGEAVSGHGNVRLVDWASMVAEDESLLAADSVHATPGGYARRAEETARVARACRGRE